MSSEIFKEDFQMGLTAPESLGICNILGQKLQQSATGHKNSGCHYEVFLQQRFILFIQGCYVMSPNSALPFLTVLNRMHNLMSDRGVSPVLKQWRCC